MTLKRKVIVTNNFRGYHKYAEAPDNVSFLRNMHRHVFNVKTTIEVFHNERDIEFFQLQNDIENYVKLRFNEGCNTYIEGIYIESCESLAEAILGHLHKTYPNRSVRVEVWEDNENGAILED